MDGKPVAVLKRKSSDGTTQFELCLFCQGKKHEKLRDATNEGRGKVVQCLKKRRNFRDLSNTDLFDRLERITEDEWASFHLKWHKSCYSTFTSVTNLTRLESITG